MALYRGGHALPLKVMFIGDSITVGGTGGAESTTRGGWRASLLALINTRLGRWVQDCGSQQNGSLGLNRMCGANGQRTDELFDPPYASVQIPQYKPDVVFLHIGTNDATQRNSGASLKSLQDCFDDTTAILDLIRQHCPQASVFLAKIVPNQTAGANDNIVAYNSGLDALVTARSDVSFITVVDHYSAFTANASWATDYMNDTTHPNAAGNTVMVNTWYAAFITRY